MQTHTSRFPLKNSGLPAFDFAGFSWPRYLATLPTGSKAARLERYKKPITGPYYHAPKPESAGRGKGFYLDSAGAPGLRWTWADEVEGSRIRHTGWFTDECEDSIMRGVVFRLPKGRGFLAGWSMGEGMASAVEGEVFDDEIDCARAADSLAETLAEREREYQAAQMAEDGEAA